MGPQFDPQYQGATGPANAQSLAVHDPRRDLDIDHACAAILADRYAPPGSRVGLLNRHVDLAAIGLGLRVAAWTAAGHPRPRSKQTGKEIAEPIQIGKTMAARLAEPLLPIGRRTELLARSVVAAQLVVGRTLVRIPEDFVSLLNVFELRFGVLFLTDVRMVLACQFAIGALDLLRIGAARNTESFVIILELHAPNLMSCS